MNDYITIKQKLSKDCEGIEHVTSCIYTSQNNAVIECYWRTLLNTTQTLIYQSSIPKQFTNEALRIENSLLQFRIHSIQKNPPIYELYYGCFPEYKSLHTFGCICYITVLSPNPSDKLSKRAYPGIFVGYTEHKLNEFRVYDLEDNKLIISLDMQFDQMKFSNAKSLSQVERDKVQLNFVQIEKHNRLIPKKKNYYQSLDN